MKLALSSFWRSFVNGGTTAADNSYYTQIIRFFNVITLYGIVTGLMQIFMALPFDKYTAIFHTIWTASCVVALVINRFNHFKVARFIIFFFVFLFGGLASARLGHEFYPHFGSFGIVVACFIMYDFKKEWGWIAFFMVIEVVMIALVETNAFKADNVLAGSPYFFRTTTLIATMAFVMIQFTYYVKLTIKSERVNSDKLKLTNEELILRDKEKNTLLKEIHHRVKNNLQIISSLLRLQSNEIKDIDSKQKFRDAVNRVQSISMLHEIMYKSDNILRFDFKHYLSSVVKNLSESYGLTKNISLEVESDLDNAQNDCIIPVSLILNELLTNSLKHAFDDKDDCAISVRVKKIEDNMFRLHYRDNGNWKINTGDSTFGIELIKSLSEQLDGEIEQSPDSESSLYIIRFRVNNF